MTDRPTVEAQRATKCPGCGEGISEGDTIFLIDGEWCCQWCDLDADAPS